MEFKPGSIKAAMIAKCLTVRQVAKAAGVSETTLYRAMYHGSKANTATVGRVAAALDVPPARLIRSDTDFLE